jgi:hypothetical protein
MRRKRTSPPGDLARHPTAIEIDATGKSYHTRRSFQPIISQKYKPHAVRTPLRGNQRWVAGILLPRVWIKPVVDAGRNPGNGRVLDPAFPIRPGRMERPSGNPRSCIALSHRQRRGLVYSTPRSEGMGVRAGSESSRSAGRMNP